MYSTPQRMENIPKGSRILPSKKKSYRSVGLEKIAIWGYSDRVYKEIKVSHHQENP
jgi:hypothetical protein